MGTSCSKENKIYVDNLPLSSAPSAAPFLHQYVTNTILICDNIGYIKNMSQPILDRLHFNKETLYDSFIGIVMSDFMSYLHEAVYIKRFNTATQYNLNIIKNKLSHLSDKRSLIIYDIYKKPHIINMKITQHDTVPAHIVDTLIYKNTAELYNIFLIELIFINESIALFNTDSILLQRKETFNVTKNKLIILSIDVMNSADIMHTTGAHSIAYMNGKIYDMIIMLIRTKYYPFIYLHENVGSGFIVVLNADWTYNISTFCASLAVNFIHDLIMHTHTYINMNIGMTYGEMHYGYIGNTLRLFGDPINIACRLGDKCELGYVNIDEAAYCKLSKELYALHKEKLAEYTIYEKMATFNEYGSIKYYAINIVDIAYNLFEFMNTDSPIDRIGYMSRFNGDSEITPMYSIVPSKEDIEVSNVSSCPYSSALQGKQQ